MASADIDATTKLNLSKASALLLDGSTYGLDILAQIMLGFGVRTLYRCATIEEARRAFEMHTIDLIIADPDLPEGGGHDFLRWMRRSNRTPNCHAPIILITGHAQISHVTKARDVGANFIVAKPLQPGVLWQRMLWIARENRAFVECDVYCGPDRRFRNSGPPMGTAGRRSTDLSLEIGASSDANMSDDELSSFIKPQKVAL